MAWEWRLTPSGTKNAVLGDRSCPGENLLRRSGRSVWIDGGDRQLAGDRMRDNPIRHGRSPSCLEASNGQVGAAPDATRVRFHQYVAPILARPEHALKNVCAEELKPRLGQRRMLQVI